MRAQRGAVALAVAGFVKTVESCPVGAEQRRHTIGFVKPVEIDQQAHHAVAEAMPHGLQPCMHHFAKVETGCVVASRDRVSHGYSAASASPAGSSCHGAVAPS